MISCFPGTGTLAIPSIPVLTLGLMAPPCSLPLEGAMLLGQSAASAPPLGVTVLDPEALVRPPDPERLCAGQQDTTVFPAPHFSGGPVALGFSGVC